MKGYPEYFATKEDYENIIRDFPEWHGKVKKELNALVAAKDDKVLRATTLKNPLKPELGYNVVEMANPSPRYKQKRFESRAEISALIARKAEKGKLK